ncbi:YSIRK-type signal peptide-containing protein, partial [Staphylococcus condimenti]
MCLKKKGEMQYMKKKRSAFMADARRSNRYSIRKLTLGTASIIVGATLVFGIGGEARAAEVNNSSQNGSSNNGQSEDGNQTGEASQQTPDNTTTPPTNDVQQTNTTSQQSDQSDSATAEQQPEQSTTAPSQNKEDTSTSENTQPQQQSADSASNETQTPESTTSADKETVKDSNSTSGTNQKEDSTVNKEDASTQDSGINQVKQETQNTPQQETAKQVDQPQSVPQTDQSKATDTQTADSQQVNPQTKQTTTNIKEVAAESNTAKPTEQPTGQTLQNTETQSKSDQTSLPQSESNIENSNTSQIQTLEAVDNSSSNTVNPNPVSTDRTASTNAGAGGLANNQQVQKLADEAGVQATDSPEVAMAKMLQQSSNNKDANTIQATAPKGATTRRMMRAMVTPESTTSNTNTNTTSSQPTGNAAAQVQTFSSPAQTNTTPIVADALADGYIKSTTDATNAAHTLSGRAWVVDHGTPATMSNGLTPVPEGTNVYMQWIDTDGAVSPVYTAKTTNKLGSSDGSQVGPGAYAFDLRQGWTDLNGKTHTYSAIGSQDYRLWINDYQTENGNTATMLRQAGGFFPGSYVGSATSSNLGQFPLAGTNMQRTGIYMTVKPTSGYMTKPDAEQIHDTLGPINAPSVNLAAKNSVSGNVWLETGAGDQANSGTGPNKNLALGDKVAAGYRVVMSSLTKDGAKDYDAKVNSLPQDQRSAAAKTLLEAHPEYISATVYGETDANGNYTLRFPAGTLDTSHMYGYVEDPNGNIVNTYSSFTSPQFQAPNNNLSWTPQTSPAQNLVANPMWYNVNFAVVPTSNVTIDVLNYNATTTPAAPGSDVSIALPGTTLSPLPTHIEWRDSTGKVISKTADFTTIDEGEALGGFKVPTNATAGSIYTAYLVSGGNDVSADSFIVQTYNKAYDPTATPVNNQYNTPTTSGQVTGSVTIPNYPADQPAPKITVNDPSSLPDGKTPGTVNVPVTVTYPDGTTDTVNVPVTTAEPQNNSYEPTTYPVNNPNGTPTTEEQVKDNVTVPNYPTDGPQPQVTVDDPSSLPDGTTPGTVKVPVTVTYPDGTTDHVDVDVTTGATDAAQYNPTADPVNNNFGTPTTEEDVTNNVKVPDYPTDAAQQPTITVEDPSTLPDGTTPGTTDVSVIVTYPDGTSDHITVPVTTGNPQADTYTPETTDITNPSGTATTEEQIKDNVTVPNYPADGPQPQVTVDDPTSLPDGNTPGTVEVPVTVTYPDGSTDQTTVKVTTTPVTALQYEPTAEPITKPHGTPTTAEDVIGNVSVPDYPTDGPQPTITIDEGTTLPDGNTTGTENIPVTVTYPDGSIDKVVVPVTTQPSTAEEYDPTAGTITHNFGTPTTENEVVNSVTVPGYPTDGEQPVITVDDPSNLPDGQTTGSVKVPVTVTYPDGSKDQVEVTVNTGDSQAVQYDPETKPVNNPYGDPVTEEQVTNNVTVPNYPITADQQPTVTVDDPSSLPDGNTPGTTNVPVTVTYPDGTTDHTTVEVTIGEKNSDTYDPTANPINNKYGTPTTADQVIGNVIVPNYPTEGPQPVITVDDPTNLPNGQTTGTVEVPVTVTYPDSTTDHINVQVNTGDSNAAIYDPETKAVDNPYGTPTTADQVTTNVTVPNYPADAEPPVVSVDNPENLPNGTTTGTVEVPVTVTYPDGTTDHTTVTVNTGDSLATTNEPTASPVTHQFGDPTTTEEVINNVSVPNYPEGQTPPTITIDEGTVLPNGTVPGTTEVPVTVTYPDGSTDHITVPVTTQPAAPVVNPVEAGSSEVTGTGYPEGTVTVTLPDGTTETATVDPSGNWKVETDNPLKDSDVVNATQTVGTTNDNQPNTSPVGTTTVEDTKAPSAPPINPVEAGSTEVTGTGEPGGTVTVTFPDGTTGTGTVDNDGNWSVPVPEGTTLNNGDEVTANETDKAGNTSTDSTATVTDTKAPSAPPINPVEAGSSEVTGTGTPGDTVTVTFPDGTTGTGKVDNDGNWTVDVPEGTTLNNGDKVTANETDEAGNTSPSNASTVTDTQAPDAPVINPVEAGSTEITGTGEPDSTVTVTFPDGTTGTGTVDNDGNWTVPVPEGTTLNNGDEVTANETDKAGNTSTDTTATVTDTQAPDAPVINPVNTGDNTVTGTGEPGGTVTVTFPDGTTGTGTVDNDGNWKVPVPEG